MKKLKILATIPLVIALLSTSCSNDELISSNDETKTDNTELKYIVQYTDQQLENWKNTGSPYLDNELENSSNTLIDPTLPSKAGVFTPIKEIQSRAWAPNPNQNRFWSMIRLKLAIPDSHYRLKNIVINAISEIESKTNVRFFNAIFEPDTDPTWGFKYPNVHIAVTKGKKIGSSFVGRKGGEQYIYLPENADMPFVLRALCNVAGMYNEQQRNNRDDYVKVNTANITPENRYHFDRITRNYYGIGFFDMESITLAGTYQYSYDPNLKSIVKKNGAIIYPNTELSELDRSFLNRLYLPYIARSDVYRELDSNVYKANNEPLTEEERFSLQKRLNDGKPYPPSDGRLERNDW